MVSSDGLPSVGQHLRLIGLKARPDLNGAHATAVAAVSSAESAELAEKRRVKIATALANEVLSVRRENAEIIEGEALQRCVFSMPHFAVHQQSGRGCCWIAQRRISAGKVLWREEPLIVYAFADYLADPMVSHINEQLGPYLAREHYPPEAMALLEQGSNRIAELTLAKLSPGDCRRCMALADAFSTPPAKSPGNIYRTNTFGREDIDGGILYEVLSRINHSCDPNVVKVYDGFTAVVRAARDVESGEELCISCACSARQNSHNLPSQR